MGGTARVLSLRGHAGHVRSASKQKQHLDPAQSDIAEIHDSFRVLLLFVVDSTKKLRDASNLFEDFFGLAVGLPGHARRAPPPSPALASAFVGIQRVKGHGRSSYRVPQAHRLFDLSLVRLRRCFGQLSGPENPVGGLKNPLGRALADCFPVSPRLYVPAPKLRTGQPDRFAA